MPVWGWAILIPVAYLLFWSWIIWLMAHLSGWSNLAHFYGATAPFHGTMRRYQEHVRAYPNVRSQLLSIGNGEEMSVRIA